MSYATEVLVIDAARIAHRECGSGPPLLFLHGAGGAGSVLPWARRFAATNRVLVPDHPSFGDSDDAPWLDNIHDLAYYYLDYCDALGLRDVHLVGTSLGGWLALELAIRDPSRFAAITLIGASGIRPGDIATGDLFLWSPAERVQKLVFDPALAARILAVPQTPEQQAVALRNHFATAKLAWEPRFFDPHLEKWLHRIRMPAHVVWGADDQLFPVAYGRKLAACIPGARFSVIANCGHLPHVEAPEPLYELVASAPGLIPRQ